MSRLKDPWFVGLVALIGLVAGLCLWILTIALSRGNVSGDGWTLSGNGALVVPFGIGPAVVAGGWAGIILRMRGHPHWQLLGVGGALVGLALVAASVLCLIVFGPRGRDASARSAGGARALPAGHGEETDVTCDLLRVLGLSCRDLAPTPEAAAVDAQPARRCGGDRDDKARQQSCRDDRHRSRQ